MKTKRFLTLLLGVMMLLCIIPLMVFASDATPVETQYVKVNSVDEIIPNARYIIVGTYTDSITGEVSYHAMGKENRPNDGFRYSYAQEQNGTLHFDISEDKNNITVYSYATYDPILRLRIRPRDDEGRFYLGVDGKGYLCGFSNRTSDGAIGHDLHSCMPISYYTIGETWWYMRVVESGDYAGDWQIVNRSRLANYSGYYYDVIQMGRPYPNFAGQFRAEPAYLKDVGVIDEDERIKHTVDYDTNILLYREICSHSANEVTHMSAMESTCAQPGIVEYWYCAGCCQYFFDEDMTNEGTLESAIVSPPAHDYNASGICTVCGQSKIEKSFLEYEHEGSFSSNMAGTAFIAVGFKDGKAYVMGNNTNPDGSREAIEVAIQPNGTIKTDTSIAEFLTYDFDENTFSPDNGYMTVLGNQIVVYDKILVDSEGLPDPIYYNCDSYYDNAGYFYRFPADSGYRYIVFDSESLSFKPSKTGSDSIYLYEEVCSHPDAGWHYFPYTKPTCTENGSVEYWCCDECGNYYQNGEFEVPADLGDYYEEILENLTLKATGHNYNSKGVCKNCGMKRPVYTQVSTLTQFDQLDKDSQYLIVIKDGAKTYAAALPVNPCDVDSDGDGVVDALDIDENENTIPDAIEELFAFYEYGDMNGDGIVDVGDYSEWIGDQDDNGIFDFEDYRIFIEYNYWDFVYMSEMYCSNFVEVTMAADGSITLANEGAMEFQMIPSGIWGGAPYFDEDFEYAGITENERIRAFWSSDFWIGGNGMMGYYSENHFMTQERILGDEEYPGIIDMKNWKISFRADGTACLVATWSDYDDTGALQFVKYVNDLSEDDMTIVGLPDSLWGDSPIMLTATDKLPVYLYASEPVFAVPEEIVSPDNTKIKLTVPFDSDAILESGTVLKATEVTDEMSDDIKANIAIVVGNDNVGVVASYDISLVLGGVTVQPGGMVKVTLPIPEDASGYDEFKIVYIDDDGNVTPCDAYLNGDGTITFETDHFSHYAIIGTHKYNEHGYCELCQVKIIGASITVGQDLTMNYAVKLYDESLLGEGQRLAMRFTMNDKSVTVYARETLCEQGDYVFAFAGIGPQCMTDNIKAELLLGETVIASKNEYSVKTNAESLLEKYSHDMELKQLLVDMLTYGAAAQNYKDYNLEKLANKNLPSDVLPSDILPAETHTSIEKSTSDTVFFKSATVWFDHVNRICVKLSTNENVTLKVNGKTLALTDTAYYTDAIYATDFDRVYTFELYEGEALVQTLTYSVTSYVYAKMGNVVDGEPTEMAVLAKTLYRYGVSAVAYQNSK